MSKTSEIGNDLQRIFMGKTTIHIEELLEVLREEGGISNISINDDTTKFIMVNYSYRNSDFTCITNKLYREFGLIINGYNKVSETLYLRHVSDIK